MFDSIGTILMIISNISKSIPIQIQKSHHFSSLPSNPSIAQSQNNPSLISLQTLIIEYNFNYKLTIITINNNETL